MKLNIYFSFILLLLFSSLRSSAQNCPENIGFEEGTFNRWKTLSGNISTSGVITVNPVDPINGIHTLNQYSYPQIKDLYGNFPITSPNGSKYAVMLGNNSLNRGAERITYTFTVPTNTSGYSFIYNYAVVLENPQDHLAYEQPKFTAKLFDVTANQYVSCGSFEYIAAPGLPGFQVSNVKANVYYKKWSPVTINLSGFEGKTMRLEFTTNDCSKGGHFGYAYIDVNENCSSPISGSAYCDDDQMLTLRAPEGFKEYYWYKENEPAVLGNSNTLSISPTPPNGTKYQLKVIPYDDQGCTSIFNTTIKAVNEVVNLVVKPVLTACESDGVNLNQSFVTEGSSAGLVYSYYSNADATIPLPDAIVREPGTYYIKAENVAGCYKIKPVQIILLLSPVIKIKSINTACLPNTFDLDNAVDGANSSPGTAYTYWADAQTTVPLTNPHQINQSGIYYIKGIYEECATVVPVVVNVYPVPVLSLHNAAGCSPVNLTSANVYAGSTPGLSYTYWTNAAATVSVNNASAITTSGTYYLKGTSGGGCSSIAPVNVTVYPLPSVTINTAVATFPETVNVEDAVDQTTSAILSYWRDAAATLALTDYYAIKTGGTYYVKAIGTNGCISVLPVVVTILPPPDPVIVINNTFTPNSDGVNDLFKIKMEGVVTLRNFKIYNRYGQLVYISTSASEPWDGSNNGQPVPTGTYYWIFEGINDYSKKRLLQSGSVTVIR